MNIFKMLYLALVVFVMYLFFTIGFPFLMALVLALLLEPLILILSRLMKGRRMIASVLTCTTFVLLILGSGFLLGTKGVKETISLSKSVISYIKDNYEQITDLSFMTETFLGQILKTFDLQLNDFVKTGLDSLQAIVLGLSESLINMIQGIPSLIFDAIIFVIAFYLISMTLPATKKMILNFFDPSSHHKIEDVMNKLYKAIFDFIRAQIILSFLIFIITLFGLLFIGVKYPLATAAIVTTVDILPILGAGTVILPMTIFYLIQGNYFFSICLLILYVVLFVFRRIVEPKVLGDAIGISALSALASIYIGFKVAGVIGLFLGPATVILIKALISADIVKIKFKV